MARRQARHASAAERRGDGEGVPGDTWSKPPVNAIQAHNDIYASLAGHVGGPVPPNNLFIWADNKFLPECCFYYSDYSTDKGCPCITPEQQYYLQRRGLNRDKNCFLKETNDYANVFFSPTSVFKK